MSTFDKYYWAARYQQQNTPWDIGSPSDPLKKIIDSLPNQEISILIPGAGNAYEAEYLWKLGFKNVVVLDIVAAPLKELAAQIPDFPPSQLVHQDFFEHEGQYDLILEQTFFCALDPSFRENYARKMAQLLKPGGKLRGVLFGVPMNIDQPPFGGHVSEYEALFKRYFSDVQITPCHDSIGPRMGKEVWLNCML